MEENIKSTSYYSLLQESKLIFLYYNFFSFLDLSLNIKFSH